LSRLRVIQWSTGDIARHQVRLAAASPSLELVGAFVHHDAKHGLDVWEIAGIVSPLDLTLARMVRTR
jgi:hypothetical protein